MLHLVLDIPLMSCVCMKMVKMVVSMELVEMCL